MQLQHKSPRALCLAVVLAAALPARAEGSGDTRAQAVRLAAEGAAAYKSEKYPDALGKFSAAYRLFPAAPLLLNISRSDLKLGRCNDAIRYAEQYRVAVGNSLGASPDSPGDWLSMVRRTCIDSEIKSKPAGAALWIDGERQTEPEKTPWTGRLTVGKHRVLLWLPGYTKREAALDVSADAPAYLEMTLVPDIAPAPMTASTPPPPPSSETARKPPVVAHTESGASIPAESHHRALRWEPFVPAAVGLAGLAMAIAGGVLSGQCPTKVGPASDVYAAESCQYNRAGFADVGWGLAGAGAVTAAVLWLVLKPSPPAQEPPPIAAGVTGNGAFFAGRF